MKKILTLIFDGFGMRDEAKGNAVKAAKMHTFEELWNNCPHALLEASEEKIGLLPKQMGNSEIGHMTIGAGHIIKSPILLINDFFANPTSSDIFAELVCNSDKRVHIMGLCSDGKIHSTVEHFINMYELLVKNGFKNIYFHLITDGRDTKVDSAYKYIEMVQNAINKYNIGQIATVCGRYYAMDRDTNYERTKLYYDLITRGIGKQVINIKEALQSYYYQNITDEFMKPILLDKEGLIRDDDTLIWMNYRTDRAKQILRSFVDKKFDAFPVYNFENLNVYSVLEVDKNIKTKVIVGENKVENPLGIYLSKLNLKQARVSESEKFPHVTYFFDGQYNGKIENCDKFNIPSPEVPTFDLKPEMSVVSVTKKIIECMEKDYDFIFANFANPDMVGHTGNMDAATKACMAIDICLSKILEAAENNFYTVILTADHGNCDTMYNEDGSPCTTHSLAKVPLIISDKKVKLKGEGDLTNIAPTILDYMNISIPQQMTSDSLIIKD